MTARTSIMIMLFILPVTMPNYAQNEVTATIEEAKQFYLQKNLSESIHSLDRALELLHQELLTQLESVFPAPLDNWRVERPSGQVTRTAYATSLISKCKFFKKGGGQSVEIEIQTNAPGIANIKMLFVNPAMISQAGEEAKIATISDRTCIERYDPIDKFAELRFVPSSSILISIRGYEMKDTRIVAQYAERMRWDLLEEIFP